MSELLQSYRVITFVPAGKAEEFIAEITPYIPHLFGPYDSVLWWSEPKIEHGTEQFRKQKMGAEIEQVPSVRIEFSIPKNEALKAQFINDYIIPNHPWDEPVILVQDTEIIKK